MPLTGRSLVSLSDLSLDEVLTMLDVADRMAEAIGLGEEPIRAPVAPLDRILATLFFEPSTRTRLSFEAAMLRLGGHVVGFADPSASSTAKGETLADTARMAGAYADIVVIRHPLAGSARVAADYAGVPVINAGDGPREHPTQTLTDLFCIRRNKGRLDGLTVGLCGDLKHGRTVHSLAPVMARLGSQVVCIAPEELRMPEEVLGEVERISGERPREAQTIEEALPDLDVLYMTRVQRERFDDPANYERVRGVYVLTPELMRRAPEDMIVLHPLPRVDEIAVGVDADARAKYFEQAAGGVPVRMALTALLLGLDDRTAARGSFRLGETAAQMAAETVATGGDDPPAPEPKAVPGARCGNTKCITSTEAYLEGLFVEGAGRLRCGYCGEEGS